MAGLENIANWMVATPARAMDLSPFVAGVLNIQAAAEANHMAQQAFDESKSVTARSQSLAEKTQADQSSIAKRQQSTVEKEAAKVPTLYNVNRGGAYNNSWTWGMGSGGLVQGGGWLNQ